MDPYLMIGQSLASGLNQLSERRQRKKDLTKEQEYRLAAMAYNQQLQDQAPTPEMKTMRGLGLPMNTEGIKQLQMAQNPFGSQEMALKEGALGLQQQNAASENEYRRWQMGKPQATSQQQNIEYLVGMGVPKEQAMQMVFRPDEFQLMLMEQARRRQQGAGQAAPQIPPYMGGGVPLGGVPSGYK